VTDSSFTSVYMCISLIPHNGGNGPFKMKPLPLFHLPFWSGPDSGETWWNGPPIRSPPMKAPSSEYRCGSRFSMYFSATRGIIPTTHIKMSRITRDLISIPFIYSSTIFLYAHWNTLLYVCENDSARRQHNKISVHYNMKTEKFDPVCAVMINEDEGNICQIKIDVSGDKQDISKLLKGTATFIGQWEDERVVIMKCDYTPFDLMANQNVLPWPFHDEVVAGPILLIRMDDNAIPADFTLPEYDRMQETMKPRPV
jgi:hypothetical protein